MILEVLTIYKIDHSVFEIENKNQKAQISG
jgi:hypothetical protein